MKKTTESDLARLWRELGICGGMVVLCHSFLPALGKVERMQDVLVDSVLSRLGSDGTLVVPTFTYSYFRNEVYDAERSPGTVGMLGELVRNRTDAVRSLDPNFSMAAVGRNARTLMRRDTPHSLGAGSIYDKLMKADLQVLLLGVDYSALPLFMHLEKLHGVDYRYDKEFKGTTDAAGRRYDDVAIHFVRDENRMPISYRNRVGGVIDRDSRCKQVRFGYSVHRFMPASLVASVVEVELKKDPFCLIKEPV